MQLRTITLTTLFLFIIWCGASTQVTLTAENSTPPAGYTDSLYFGLTAGLAAPAGGAAQVWDYSNVQEDFLRIVDISNEEGNTFLPEAQSGSPGRLVFQVFSADAVHYIAADATGVYNTGRVITETTFPLTAITGNPDDTFVFLGDTVSYEGRVNELQFPMTYHDTYGNTRTERTNISLTVAAFGLSNAPVEARRYQTETRTVVGYGQVIIPLESQSASPPIDVLLIQTDRTAVDSFFLAGSVAPTALTDAFGVSQGMTSNDQSFMFHTPNLEAPVVRMNIDENGGVLDFIYRPRAADLVSGVNELSTASFITAPNPVQRGQTLRVQVEEELREGSLRLLNLNGQLVSTPALQMNAQAYELQITDQLTAGLYFLQAYDKNGRLIRAKKIIVQ